VDWWLLTGIVVVVVVGGLDVVGLIYRQHPFWQGYNRGRVLPFEWLLRRVVARK
jgi:hypothetical protein